jgi:hypothetical protein
MQIIDSNIDYIVSAAGVDIPSFTARGMPYDQSHDNTTTLPFAASGVVDVNREGHFDMFVAGYIKQELVQGQIFSTCRTMTASRQTSTT